MKKESTKDIYQVRINKLMDYIYANLDRNLSLDELADIAYFSPYHLHRVYRLLAGENLKSTVRRLRMQRAADELVKTDYPINRIAKRAGYTNTDSFTRKISNDFSVSPDAYRKERKNIVLTVNLPTMESGIMYDVEYREFDDITVAALDHKDDYMGIGEKFDKLFTYAGSKNLLNEKTRSFGLYYDDPSSVAKDELRSKACFNVDNLFEDDGEVKKHIIEGGKYAVIIHKGPYSELHSAYDWFFGPWLQENGIEPTNKPVLEEYLNDPRQVAPSELLTAIYMAIK